MGDNGIRYTINYTNVIPENLNLYISEDRLNELKEIAQIERDILNRKLGNGDSFSRYFFAKTAEEIAYGSKYKHLSDIEREVLASNIALSDEKFNAIIEDNELFNMVYFKKYYKLINYFAHTDIRYRALYDGESSAKKFVENYTKLLVNRFTKYMGAISPEVIINKINEIISFNSQKHKITKK